MSDQALGERTEGDGLESAGRADAGDSTEAVPRVRFWRHPWFLILLSGTLIWLIAAVVTGLIQDPILIPTVFLVGSFVAPVAVVAWALGRNDRSNLGVELIFVGFLAGGTLGVLASALLETYLLPSENGTYLMIGLIEESFKAMVVIGVAHFVKVRLPRDGLVLGAIVGAGFAAFESTGYAFNTFIKHTGDHPILDIVNTELTRAALSPFGHIAWTALFGGALFWAAKGGRFKVTGGLVATFVGIVMLHAAWDASTGVAILLTKGLVDGTWRFQFPNTEAWIGSPSGRELVVWQVIYDSMLALNAVIGVSWVIHNWRKYDRAKLPPDFAADELVLS